jgi:hypothetical protein
LLDRLRRDTGQDSAFGGDGVLWRAAGQQEGDDKKS